MKESDNEKLITLAIHTYEQAQILKTLLEGEGVDVFIQNVNLIQPVISAGVRVRIKESDLPKALRIIEDNNWNPNSSKKENEEEIVEDSKQILVPIDFSDYSIKASEIAFNHAYKQKDKGYKVVLFHSYYSPFYTISLPVSESLSVPSSEVKALKELVKKVNVEMEKLVDDIKQKIKEGIFPDVEFTTCIKEGIPEEEILKYAKKHNPRLIIMGTRGKTQKDLDLIGSVTGEVIDTAKIPVLAIPEYMSIKSLEEVRNVAIATSFDQRDLVLFDRFMEFAKLYNFNIFLFNISTSRDEWNEIRLAGINEYLVKQYPDQNIQYKVLGNGELLLEVEQFIHDKQIDMIVVNSHRRSFFSRLFNPSIARRMLFHTRTPLMVIKS